MFVPNGTIIGVYQTTAEVSRDTCGTRVRTQGGDTTSMGTTQQRHPSGARKGPLVERLAATAARILSGIAALSCPLLVAAVVGGVIASMLRVEAIARFAEPVPLLGRAITQNSLIDLQWHLCALMATLTIPALILSDRHVRVDFLYEHFSPRVRALVDLFGHVALALPFILLALLPAWSFMARAYLSGEGSVDGGLADRFVVKGLLPLGIALMGLAVLVDIVRRLLLLFSPGTGR
jgi:TRAP-type mannitol/chloroaromatic compound transport system permease small subunit